MKVSFTGVSLLLWAWLATLVVQAQAPERLLLIEVSAEDEAAASRLSGLSAQPVARLRDMAARDPTRAHAVLVLHAALRAVVFDTAQHRVQVVERDGSVRTRLIEDEPTPFLVAFVASELLMLEAAAPPIAAVQPTPAPSTRAPSLLARFDGQLGIDVARPYTTAWVARPQLVLGAWFAGRRPGRAHPLLAISLSGPSRVERRASAGELSLVRWDGALRLGLALPLGTVRLLAFATGQGALLHAESSLGVAQRSLALGVGLGAAIELGLTRWLALQACAQLSLMARRTLFTLYDQGVLRDAFLMPSFHLGLVLHSPWR